MTLLHLRVLNTIVALLTGVALLRACATAAPPHPVAVVFALLYLARGVYSGWEDDA